MEVQDTSFVSARCLLAAKPGAQPALCLRSLFGDLTVESVNSSVEVLAGLAGVLLAACPGLVPLLLSFGAQGIVLCLGFGTVLLSLALCLLSVGPEVSFSLLRLSTGAVCLLFVSICSTYSIKGRQMYQMMTYVILCSCADSLVPLLSGLLGLLVLTG